jgi:4-hydroxythreonine-4-phosphate dehydrogenase
MAPIVLSLGDPAGIGPQVSVSAVAALRDHSGVILVGHPDSIPKSSLDLQHYTGNCQPNTVYHLPIMADTAIVWGPDDPHNAHIALTSLEAALAIADKRPIRGLVTAPLSKKGLARAGFTATDHTTFLTRYFKASNTRMAFYSPRLKIVLATTHVPLSAVESLLTPDQLTQTLTQACAFAHTLGIPEPRIAVAGLNPHAGEQGLLGDFEARVLEPTLAAFSCQNGRIEGPYSPDVVFRKAYEGAFDIVVALYHDQGLIPLKMVAFDAGVNVTLGLPICRTSPDHGTAYDIVNHQSADPRAMAAAIDYVQRFGGPFKE